MMSDVGTFFPNGVSEATGINDAGQIVGFSNNPDFLNRHAFRHENGVMTDLGTLGGAISQANAINSAGDVVGWAQNASNRARAFVYRNGSMSDIGGNPNATTVAYAINDQGTIVGSIGINPFIYENGTFTEVFAGGGFGGAVLRGINNAGWAVGARDNTSPTFMEAFLYRNGQAIGLNSLVSLPSGHSVIDAYDINNLNQIAGTIRLPSGERYAVLLTPIPEPGGAALAGIALAALARRCRRHR
jgi:probable HAF family extracellular repeat protein